MVQRLVQAFEVLVAGDPGSGKANFINRFLANYSPSAEIRRKSSVTYFMYKPGEDIKIQLHDVSNIEDIDLKSYIKMDVAVFIYAADDSETYRCLEKWFVSMEEEKKMLCSPLKKRKVDYSVTEKEVQSFLVANLSNLGDQQDVAECLLQKAKKLKEIFGFKSFFSCSFEDEVSISGAFQTILNEIIALKRIEKPLLNRLYEEYVESVDFFLAETFPGESLKSHVGKSTLEHFPNSGDEDLELSKNRFSFFSFKVGS